MNVYNVNKAGMSKKELGTVCSRSIHNHWKKEFTLEFSRDRKSMSCYCVPQKPTKLGNGPKMFVKVCVLQHNWAWEHSCCLWVMFALNPSCLFSSSFSSSSFWLWLGENHGLLKSTVSPKPELLEKKHLNAVEVALFLNTVLSILIKVAEVK